MGLSHKGRKRRLRRPPLSDREAVELEVGELRLLAHGAQLLLSLAEDLDPPVRAWDMLFARGRTCRELLGLVQLLAVGAELLVQLCTRLAMRDLQLGELLVLELELGDERRAPW